MMSSKLYIGKQVNEHISIQLYHTDTGFYHPGPSVTGRLTQEQVDRLVQFFENLKKESKS